MTVERTVIAGTYHDSVTLMRVAEDVRTEHDLEEAFAVMGTAANTEVLADAGLLAEEAAAFEPSDLVLVARDPDAARVEAALEEMERRLQGRDGRGGTTAGGTDRSQAPRSLAKAVAETDAAQQVALVSVPSEYAAREAWHALHRGLHVQVFSDGVPVDTERRLKDHGAAHDQLVMGPDCGTAIIDGTPLGFANEVRDGRVGIVAASGTGLQEVASLVHRAGAGISHAIGTGGRDLTAAVGGTTTRQGLELLDAHDATDVIVLLSKPAASEARAAVLETVRELETPVVIDILGAETSRLAEAGTAAATLADAAAQAVGTLTGSAPEPDQFSAGIPGLATADQVRERASTLTNDRRFVRGLYTGGTLCVESALHLADSLPLGTNVGIGESLTDPQAPAGHALVDLGTETFTRGRPHPMIDPSRRGDLLRDAVTADDVAVVLLDVVLGHGTHPDPAGAVVDALPDATADGPVVIASVCGTEADPQSLSAQVDTLADAGVLVAPTNAHAAEFADTALTAAGSVGGEST